MIALDRIREVHEKIRSGRAIDSRALPSKKLKSARIAVVVLGRPRALCLVANHFLSRDECCSQKRAKREELVSVQHNWPRGF